MFLCTIRKNTKSGIVLKTLFSTREPWGGRAEKQFCKWLLRIARRRTVFGWAGIIPAAKNPRNWPCFTGQGHGRDRPVCTPGRPVCTPGRGVIDSPQLKKKLPAAACNVRQDGASEASGGHVLQRAERGAGHGAGPAGQDYQSRSFIVKIITINRVK